MRKLIALTALAVFFVGTGYFVYQQKKSSHPIWVKEGGETEASKGPSDQNRKPASVQNSGESQNETGYPLTSTQNTLPKSGEAWVYKMEKPEQTKSESVSHDSDVEESDDDAQTTAERDSENEKFFTKVSKGETTVYHPKDEKNVSYVKVTFRKGLPDGVENNDLPAFKIETDENKKIKTVSVVGELTNPKMQKAWEKVGRQVITSVLKAAPAKSAFKMERVSVRQEEHNLDLSQDVKILSWSEYIKKENADLAKEKAQRAPASLTQIPELGNFTKWSAQERTKSLTQLVKSMDSGSVDTTKNVEKFLRSKGDSKSWNFGTTALASSRSEEAQKVLVQFLNGGTNNTQKQQVLAAIATNPQHLSPEAEAALMKLIKNSKGEAYRNAMSAYGAGIRGSQDEAQRIRLESTIIGMAKNAKTQDEELGLLEAIGSSGSFAFIPILKEKIKSSNEQVRLKATYATRYMTDDDSDDVLDDAEDDSSLKVKKMAASVREFQKKRERNPHLVAGFVVEE